MKWLVVGGVVAMTLTGAVAPAHATPVTSSITASNVEPESFTQDPAPASNHDASRQSSVTTATPPPSMLLLVGTGLTGLAGMVRRRLARRQRIAW